MEDCDKKTGAGSTQRESGHCEVHTEGEGNEEYVEIIRYELRSVEDKIQLWKEVRRHTVASLRNLADYLDNIGSLTNVVVAMRGSMMNRGIAVGGGILTFAVGLSLPFLVAGAGIGLVSLVSRAVGVGGSFIGTCLGVVGGVLTVATAGAALPVVVAGCGIWFASGIARWVGVGGGLVARCVTFVGGVVMVLTASTAVVICLGGAGMCLAIPAITREILGSRHMEVVVRDIEEDLQNTENLLEELEKQIIDNDGKEELNGDIEEVKNSISGKVVVLINESSIVWDMSELKIEIRTLIKDWKHGSAHIRVIADQLEDGIEKIPQKLTLMH